MDLLERLISEYVVPPPMPGVDLPLGAKALGLLPTLVSIYRAVYFTGYKDGVLTGIALTLVVQIALLLPLMLLLIALAFLIYHFAFKVA